MDKKIIITERNRDGAKIWLEQKHDNIYTVHASKDYVLEYVSINYDELAEDATDFDSCYTDQFGNQHKCKNHSYDPSGGPYMSIDTEIATGYILKRIFDEDKTMCFELVKK